MEQNRNVGPADYVFVQTVVVRSGRRSHWLERAMGKGQVQELAWPGRLQTRPREMPPVQAPSRGRSVDFWINTVAVVTLAAFLLSLALLR